jgi:hypothetical protein
LGLFCYRPALGQRMLTVLGCRDRETEGWRVDDGARREEVRGAPEEESEERRGGEGREDCATF